MKKNREKLTMEQLMKDYKIDEQDLALAEESAVDDLEKRRILKMAVEKGNLNKTADKKADGRKSGLSHIKLWAFGLVAVLVFAMGGIAVAKMVADPDFINFLKPANEAQVEALNNSGADVEREVTANGTTVRARQIVGDSHNLYLLFDVIAPEGTVLNQEQYHFNQAYASVSTNSTGYYFESLPDDNPNDNKISMVLNLEADGKMTGKTLRLDLADLAVYVPEKADFETIIEGNWLLEVPVSYDSMSESHNINQKVEYNGNQLKVKSLEISPLALNLEINDHVLEYLAGDAEELMGIDDWENLQITMKDGSKATIRSGGCATVGPLMSINYQFDGIIEVEQIATINFCGQEIYSNQ